MQPVDKCKLALGTLWSLFTIYSLRLLLPRTERRLRERQPKFNPGELNRIYATPGRLQRVVLLVQSSLMAAVVLTDAFHRNFSDMTGISSGAVCSLMMILPGLYFCWGC